MTPEPLPAVAETAPLPRPVDAADGPHGPSSGAPHPSHAEEPDFLTRLKAHLNSVDTAQVTARGHRAEELDTCAVRSNIAQALQPYPDAVEELIMRLRTNHEQLVHALKARGALTPRARTAINDSIIILCFESLLESVPKTIFLRRLAEIADELLCSLDPPDLADVGGSLHAEGTA